MNTDQERIRYLLTHPQWTPEDEAWMAAYLQQRRHTDLQEALQSLLPEDTGNADSVDPAVSDRIRQLLMQRINAAPVYSLRRKRRKQWIAAASVALLLGAGAMLYYQRQTAHIAAAVPPVALLHDAAPGRQGAILTLGDGSRIVLDSAANGRIATQGSSIISKQDGRLQYRAGGASGEAVYNTITTPIGRQYSLELPDGTRVWLNAASSLRYATQYSGGDRVVILTGEAYFEVSHDAHRPFHVLVSGLDIQDLGTEFNINAYTDEPSVKTTLIAGAVQVHDGAASRLLQPGQQAAAVAGTGKIAVSRPDIAQAVAWKNGIFNFDHMGLPQMMRQLARWYDVKVVYEGPVPEMQFRGEMGQDLNLSQVLKALEQAHVHFTIENKTIHVLP